MGFLVWFFPPPLSSVVSLGAMVPQSPGVVVFRAEWALKKYAVHPERVRGTVAGRVEGENKEQMGL